MSVKFRTYVLYGTTVNVSEYDTNRFEDDMEYTDYLYDVINKEDSPYKIIFDETSGEYHFGFVIDEACDGNWENTYLSTQSFTQIMNSVTTEVKEAIDWMLLLHFNQRSKTSEVEYKILTVYC